MEDRKREGRYRKGVKRTEEGENMILMMCLCVVCARERGEREREREREREIYMSGLFLHIDICVHDPEHCHNQTTMLTEAHTRKH